MSAFLQETVTLPTLATKREVADYLRCSIKTVERLLADGKLDNIGGGKVGGAPVRILVASVKRLIASEAGDALLEDPATSPSPPDNASARARLPLDPLVPARRPQADLSDHVADVADVALSARRRPGGSI